MHNASVWKSRTLVQSKSITNAIGTIREWSFVFVEVKRIPGKPRGAKLRSRTSLGGQTTIDYLSLAEVLPLLMLAAGCVGDVFSLEFFLMPTRSAAQKQNPQWYDGLCNKRSGHSAEPRACFSPQQMLLAPTSS